MAFTEAWLSNHLDRELPASRPKSSGRSGRKFPVNGEEWKESKQNHEVANHGPLFPHFFLSCETYLEHLSSQLSTKAYFREATSRSNFST